jgi:hypothetical protein
MCRGERYACKDGLFGLLCSGGTDSVARMYQDTRYTILKLADLCYLMKMVHLLQVRQARYSLARDDVRAYAIAALGSSEFDEPNPATTGLIQYDQLFDELKMPLV